LLRSILPLVPRSTVVGLFTKDCPGCAALEFLCILCLHPVLDNEVYYLFRKAYKRTDYLFPYTPNCLNFDRDNKALQKTLAVGELFASDKFCALMEANPIIGTRLAHEMFNDLGNKFHQMFQLQSLLFKYDSSISEVQLSE
jgi:hypothetical protein